MKPRLWVALAFAILPLAPSHSRAGTLGTDIIGLFPREINEFAYADLKAARKFKWFTQLKEQMLPSRFRQFEQFLVTAGIDPATQVYELAWGMTAPTATVGEQVVGVALGQFDPATAEEFFKAQKLPLTRVRGFTLFAFGSGEGPTDLFFLFLDSNTAAFGHRALLEQLIEVRFGAEESLLRNDRMFPLIDEANGQGLVWAVLDPSYTRIAFHQLIPEATQFPEASKLIGKIRALTIHVGADSGVEARFQAVCETPDDANLFAALLQAGLLYRRHLEDKTNPDLAKLLDEARVTPRGDRLELRLAVSEELMNSLLKRYTFAVRM